ncbi:MAG: response regulator [Chloroflexi bacterium]|nr:response regulator [Chloroflexota bacterium]
MTTYDAEFEENIRELLSNLYDYLKLADNPVAEALAPELSGSERPAAIRRLVLGAIDAMQAEDKAGAVSRRNRLYHILQLRYVEQQSTVDVLRQLALSERQFYREHQRAIQTISRVIWDEHFASRAPAKATISLADELDYLNVDRGQRAFDVRSEIQAAIKTTRVIAQRRRIDISVIDDSAPIGLSLSQPVFRQFIVLLLSELLISQARGARIEIGLQPGPESLTIRFGGLASAAQASQCCARLQGDATARALLASLNAKLDYNEASPQVVLRLQQRLRKILVVDDNPDAIGLFKRYLAKQPYQLLSASAEDEALQIARSTPLLGIILDVMLPGKDGWQILQRFKSHPATAEIPILICSVLEMEALALSLGADGYLKKPPSRDELLALLNAWQ